MNREQITSPERIYSEKEVVELFGAIAAKRKLKFQFKEEYVTKRRDDERGLLSLEITVPLEDKGELLVLTYVRRSLRPSSDQGAYLKALARYPRIDMELGSNPPEHVATVDKKTGWWKFI